MTSSATSPQHCPCGSGKLFTDCCQPYLLKQAFPPTPEKLMRSRYSAFSLGEFAYVLDTCVEAPSDANEAEQLKEDYLGIVWLKLVILQSEPEAVYTGSDNDVVEGKVRFQAFYGMKGKVYVLEEHSVFQKIAKDNSTPEWLYDAAQSQSGMQRIKISRNDECICGSGNKFKKCCERLIR